MNRKTAKYWALYSKAELRDKGFANLAIHYDELTHFANGGDIEYRRPDNDEWLLAGSPEFYISWEYRIKAGKAIFCYSSTMNNFD